MTRADRRAAHQAANAGGGSEPSVGQNTYNSNIGYYLDEARKSPTDDPTLQPWIDALKRESQQTFERSTYDLHDQMSKESLLGTGYYGGMMGFANEQYNEGMQSQLANVYMGRLNQVEQNELNALGMQNNRDMNQANVRAQIQSARISAQPGMMQASLAGQQWRANQPYTDIERTIGIMNGLNQLGGYTATPQYIPGAPGYYGPSPGAAGFMGGIGGAMQGWGLANSWGMTGAH
jgi:hypothetical protein